jgi:hypothetical protein
MQKYSPGCIRRMIKVSSTEIQSKNISSQLSLNTNKQSIPFDSQGQREFSSKILACKVHGTVLKLIELEDRPLNIT